MPIYEYRCESCGHELEKLQSFRDPLLVTCPSCGDDALKRLMSQTSFMLKGEGWYVTDYKNGGKKPSAKDGEGSKGEAGSSADKAATTTSGDKASSSTPASSSTGGDKAPAS